MTRNELIARAYRKIGVLRTTQVMSAEQLADGVAALNLIVNEEDLRGTGQAVNLWALRTRALFLKANQSFYTRLEGVTDAVPALFSGLAPDIRDLVSAAFRDASGNDRPLLIATMQQYTALCNKAEVGHPRYVFLVEDKAPVGHQLWVWPVVAASELPTPSKVTGTDSRTYTCTKAHVATVRNRPITGSDWPLYWDPQGSGGITWQATSYTSAPLIWYAYKRPLGEFTAPTDNPDMPQGWTRYLLHRLAYDLGTDAGITLEELQMLERQYAMAYEQIFPSTRGAAKDWHNKATYF